MLRDKFALTEQGARDFKRGVGAAALANVVLMAPIGVLFTVTGAAACMRRCGTITARR